jgi:hypothetical protein
VIVPIILAAIGMLLCALIAQYVSDALERRERRKQLRAPLKRARGGR